jgi:hypothetical protein
VRRVVWLARAFRAPTFPGRLLRCHPRKFVGKKSCVLAEELLVVDAESPLWIPLRSLLEQARHFDMQDVPYCWHGWDKQQIETFLQTLPAHCTIVVAVWETLAGQQPQREVLCFGWVSEIRAGRVCTIRTLDTFRDASLPPPEQLEPGYEHALAIMRAARMQLAPVAIALFTDRQTWDEWLYTGSENEESIDKGALLASFVREGRCVLMGSQISKLSSLRSVC